VADHSWRNVVIRVSDYVTPSANVWMRFIAEDANAGSLVEALFDDFSVYEQGATGIDAPSPVDILSMYPNPAKSELMVNLKFNTSHADLVVENTLGEQVYFESFDTDGSFIQKTIPVSQLSNGIYLLKIKGDKKIMTRKFVVTH
jgi:hypothetical protein